MPDIVLIHGYGTWRTAPLFLRPQGSDGGFHAFQRSINEEKAVAFRWGIHRQFTLFSTFNIFEHIDLYFAEKKLSNERNVLDGLHIFLEREQPKVIVCHSMGCHLLINFLAIYSLPSCVRHVVFVQADLSCTDARVSEITQLLSSTQVNVINHYCGWDITLWGAAVLNHYLPAGLVGIRSQQVKNVFYPLHESIMIHNSSIRSQKFVRVIEHLCE